MAQLAQRLGHSTGLHAQYQLAVSGFFSVLRARPERFHKKPAMQWPKSLSLLRRYFRSHP